jgi:type IV pilus assembly protein PilM
LAAVEPMNVAFFRAAIGPDMRSGSYFVVFVEPESTQIMLGYKDNGILFRSTAVDLTSREVRDSEEGVMPILRDVQNTIIFAGNQYRGLEPNNLILGGIVGRDSRLSVLLESGASLSVLSLDIWSLWRTSSPIGNVGGFEVAFGLAVRNL